MSHNKYLFNLLRHTWNENPKEQVKAGGEFIRRYDQRALFLLMELLPYFQVCAGVSYLQSIVVSCATTFHGETLPLDTLENSKEQFLSYLDKNCPEKHGGYRTYNANTEVLDQSVPFFEDFFQVMYAFDTDFPGIVPRYSLRSHNKTEAIEGIDGLRLRSTVRFGCVVRECAWSEGSPDLEEDLYVKHVRSTESLRDHMRRVDLFVNPDRLYSYLVGLGVDKDLAKHLQNFAYPQALKE